MTGPLEFALFQSVSEEYMEKLFNHAWLVSHTPPPSPPVPASRRFDFASESVAIIKDINREQGDVARCATPTWQRSTKWA